MSFLFNILTKTIKFMEEIQSDRPSVITSNQSSDIMNGEISDSFILNELTSYLNLIVVHLNDNLHSDEKVLYERLISYLNSNKIFWRMRNKHLGYDGDYITIDMLMNRGTHHTSRLLNIISMYAYNNQIVKQHAYKLFESSVLAANTCVSGPCDILYISCGLCHDLKNINLKHANVTLVDINSECMSQNKETFGSYNFEYIVDNPVKYIFGANKDKTYDLILTGGLLDYVPDRLLKPFIHTCCNLLKSNGTLFVTNIDEDFVASQTLKYYCGWRLIQRSRKVLTDAFINLNDITIDIHKEFTNLAWIVKAHKISTSKL